MESRVFNQRIYRRSFRPLLAFLVSGAAFFGAVQSSQAQTDLKTPDMAAHVQACAACHGVQGQGTSNDYFPSLAGKPADYLYNQLVSFREGHRKYPPMNYLTTYMGDDFLHQIANYYASLAAPGAAAEKASVSSAALARGQDVVLHGDAARGVPACAACHGAKLSGMQPAIPNLLGLHSAYISAQLGAWRSGNRQAAAPDCMHMIATRLSDADVSAVANWLAAQTPAQNAAPVAAGSLKMPLACGSEQQ
jgi:cytochrome c553